MLARTLRARSFAQISIQQHQTQTRMFALTRPTPKDPKTFANQRSIPRLPVPKLEDSTARYLRSLRPLLDEAELAGGEAAQEALRKREDVIGDFVREGGLGRRLQQRLVDVDRSVPTNWLDDKWWIKVAYHTWRVPLLINSNWWLLFHHDKTVPADFITAGETSAERGFTAWQVHRAAWLAHRFTDFKDRLDRENILPDSSRAGPYCMHQYTRLFGQTRVPQHDADELVHAPHPHPARHITVLARDQAYEVDVIGEDGQLLPWEDVAAAMRDVVRDIESRKPDELDPPVGLLTSDDRDSWTLNREHLLSLSPQNRKTLTSIESSLFHICLDDYTLPPPSPSAPALDGHVLNCAGGDGARNRWFDKALTVAVERNSRAGMNGEHSPCDALIPSIIVDYVVAEPMPRPAPTEAQARHGVRRLRWVGDEKLKGAIESAGEKARGIIEDSDPSQLWFADYGADWIKKIARLPPDAYLQMALQLAWFKDQGYLSATYETASTRIFAHGRTEVIRTLSSDSRAFVRAMMDESVSHHDKYTLLAKATSAHSSYTRDASLGKGCDRHLMALKLLLRPGESHSLFDDELYAKSSEWKLSTSGLSAGDRFLGTGFGTVYPDGYGINYLAGAHLIKFGIESKHSCQRTSTQRFKRAVEEAMREMREVCEKGAPAPEVGKAKL